MAIKVRAAQWQAKEDQRAGHRLRLSTARQQAWTGWGLRTPWLGTRPLEHENIICLCCLRPRSFGPGASRSQQSSVAQFSAILSAVRWLGLQTGRGQRRKQAPTWVGSFYQGSGGFHCPCWP